MLVILAGQDLPVGLRGRPITAVGRHQEQLSLQDLPAGLYFLHLQTLQGSAVLRIVRE